MAGGPMDRVAEGGESLREPRSLRLDIQFPGFRRRQRIAGRNVCHAGLLPRAGNAAGAGPDLRGVRSDGASHHYRPRVLAAEIQPRSEYRRQVDSDQPPQHAFDDHRGHARGRALSSSAKRRTGAELQRQRDRRLLVTGGSQSGKPGESKVATMEYRGTTAPHGVCPAGAGGTGRTGHSASAGRPRLRRLHPSSAVPARRHESRRPPHPAAAAGRVGAGPSDRVRQCSGAAFWCAASSDNRSTRCAVPWGSAA